MRFPEAIRKGVEDAKKNIITVSVKGTTIPHRVDYKFGSATIMLKPAVKVPVSSRAVQPVLLSSSRG
jgi:ribosomal protein S5